MLDPTSSFGRRFKPCPRHRTGGLPDPGKFRFHREHPALPRSAPGTGPCRTRSLFCEIPTRFSQFEQKHQFFGLTFEVRRRKRGADSGAQMRLRSAAGGVAEWSIALVLKTSERASVPWVRIPPPPPFSLELYSLVRMAIAAKPLHFDRNWRAAASVLIAGTKVPLRIFLNYLLDHACMCALRKKTSLCVGPANQASSDKKGAQPPCVVP